MSSWLEKKQRNLGFTLYIIPWLAPLQISFLKSDCVMPTSLNAFTLTSLEQKRLYEEENVFLLSLEYSAPAVFIWLMDFP